MRVTLKLDLYLQNRGLVQTTKCVIRRTRQWTLKTSWFITHYLLEKKQLLQHQQPVCQIHKGKKFKISIRKKDIRNIPRGGTNSMFKSKISDAFGIKKERVLTGVHQSMPSSQLLTDEMYVKPSKGATQSTHRLLSDDNFK